MVEITIGQIIKMILGILVAVAVIFGVSKFFSNYVLDYFNNLPGGIELFLSLY